MKIMLKPVLVLSLIWWGFDALAQVSTDRYAVAHGVRDFQMYPSANTNFTGHIDHKIHQVIENRLKAQDMEEIVDVFRHRNESRWWQTEFWGKWMLGAAKAYEYSKDPQLYQMMKNSTREIMDTQSKDGYIGNYAPDKHLQNWDIWGRKYTMLGLLYYYDLSGDKTVLKSAERLADHLMTEVGPGKADIVKTGNFRGMPSSSVLEPIMLLYERTGKKKYLDFGQYIVDQWETPDGPQLISKALQGVPVSERFPNFKSWWSWDNGQKAYEMMSCYDGLLRLYQFTGDSTYLEAVIKTVKNIEDDEINIVGSGSAFECWYKGKEKQVYPTARAMETCVTITWMKLCYELYRFTGNPLLINNIETAAFNHLLGALMPDGSRFSKYSALEGFRGHDAYQCDMHINCCMANGPRGLMMLPDLAVMSHQNDLVVNLFSPSSDRATLKNGTGVNLQIKGNYPVSGDVQVTLHPEKPARFGVWLRIPPWSGTTEILVNGRAVGQAVEPGEYFKINQDWKDGDVISLRFDMAGRVLTYRDKNGAETFLAFAHGPMVLAVDSRFNQFDVDDGIVRKDWKGRINLTPKKPNNTKAWMAFEAEYESGTGEDPVDLNVTLIDYSSAGNAWESSDRYRVWIPEIYNPLMEREARMKKTNP